MTRSRAITLAILATLPAGCSALPTSGKELMDYMNPEICWVEQDKLRAFLVVYEIGQEQFTFDFVSVLCDAREYNLGEPRTFVVGYSPDSAHSTDILDTLGITGSVSPNQIQPTPSIEKVVAIYKVSAKARVTKSGSGQLWISSLKINSFSEFEGSPTDFFENHLFDLR